MSIRLLMDFVTMWYFNRYLNNLPETVVTRVSICSDTYRGQNRNKVCYDRNSESYSKCKP